MKFDLTRSLLTNRVGFFTRYQQRSLSMPNMPKNLLQFMMFQPAKPSPLLHAIWDDKFASTIPINSFERNDEQKKYMDGVAANIGKSIVEIIELSEQHRDKNYEMSLSTPEYCFATGVPLTEHHLFQICKQIFDNIEYKEKVDLHLASFLIHRTDETDYFKMMPVTFNKDEPEILNVAIVAGAENGKNKIKVYYKQIVDPNDIFYSFNKQRGISSASEISLERLITKSHPGLTNSNRIAVGEICLENLAGVGLYATARKIGEIMKTNESSNPTGYQVLSSDTINPTLEHAAFPIFAQNDARRLPSVKIIDDELNQTTEVPIAKEVISDESSNSVIQGKLYVFTPIELKPMRARVYEAVKDIQEQEDCQATKSVTYAP